MYSKIFVAISLLLSINSFAAEDIYSLPTEPVNSGKTPLTVAPVKTPDISIADKAVDRAAAAAGVSTEPLNEAPTQAYTATQANTPPMAGPQTNVAGATPVNLAQISPENAGQVISRRDDSMDYLRKLYKSHQVLEMKAGGTQTLPIALGATNRIATTFKHVTFTTSVSKDLAIIYTEDGFVYVTPGTNSGPIDLIIEEDGAPSTAVSMYLVPLNVPPVLVELTVDYNKYQNQAASVAVTKFEETEKESIEKAKQEERERITAEQPIAEDHVSSVMSLLETVAKAQIPSGFELLQGNDIPAASRFPCDISQMLPLYHETKQRLVGAKTVIDILEVKNDVNGLRSFRDEACMGPGREDVIAVGVLDKATLAPGESTEVYIMRDRTYWERQKRIPKRARVGGE